MIGRRRTAAGLVAACLWSATETRPKSWLVAPTRAYIDLPTSRPSRRRDQPVGRVPAKWALAVGVAGRSCTGRQRCIERSFMFAAHDRVGGPPPARPEHGRRRPRPVVDPVEEGEIAAAQIAADLDPGVAVYREGSSRRRPRARATSASGRDGLTALLRPEFFENPASRCPRWRSGREESRFTARPASGRQRERDDARHVVAKFI